MKKRSPEWQLDVRGVRSRNDGLYYEISVNSDPVAYLSVAAFVRNERECLAGLLDQGLPVPIVGPRKAEMRAKIANVMDFFPEPMLDRFGHDCPFFVYPDGSVFAPPNAPTAKVIVRPRADRCRQAGTLDGWRNEVAGPLAGHHICEFFMSVPFAGPLRAFTSRTDNFGWDLSGPKGCGKSVMLQLMASACGGSQNGPEGNFGLSFAATAVGLEQEMQVYSDLVMLIDEATLFEQNQSRMVRGRAFSQLFMALGKGEEKRRHGADSRAFRFVFATTSNEPLAEVLEGSNSSAVAAAVADRLMTVSLDKRRHGIFDRIGGRRVDPGELITALIAAKTQHYGVAMRAYLAKLIELAAEDSAVFRNKLDNHISDFRREVLIPSSDGSARRVADAFGLVYAASMLAKHFDVLPANYDPLRSTLACYRLHAVSSVTESGSMEILRGLLDDRKTIDLDAVSRVEMSDAEFHSALAFKTTNRKGQREILIPPASVRRLFPDWNNVRRNDADIAKMIVRDSDRQTTKRHIRRGHRPDRVVCIAFTARPKRR